MIDFRGRKRIAISILSDVAHGIKRNHWVETAMFYIRSAKDKGGKKDDEI